MSKTALVMGMGMVVTAMTLGGCRTGGSGPVVSEVPRVERVATGYQFTEGPASDAAGNIYFTDIPNNRIIRYDVEEEIAEVIIEDSGGANGLMFDDRGRLIIAEGGRRRVVRIDPQTGEEVVLADSYQGRRLNSPNDVMADAVGGVYFTDPRYGNRDNMELETEGVYYIFPDAAGDADEGEEEDEAPALKRIISQLGRPNGLILSNDGRTLYVADNEAKNIWAFHLKGRARLEDPRIFAWMDPNADGGGDGMTIDARGNVYCAGQGMIWIWDPSGRLIDQIPVPENPSNCTFGGPNHQTLYITARTSLYRVEMGVPGGRWSGRGPVTEPAESEEEE